MQQTLHRVRGAGAPRRRPLCRRCRRRAEAAAAKSPCPRCGKPGRLRESTGWCGSCSRPGPAKDPPRICAACGQLRRHAAWGLCSACFQRHPDRPLLRGQHLIADLDPPPSWLADFVVFIAARFSPARATTLIAQLGRLLADEQPNHPQAVFDRARRPGRSIGSLARGLEEFFTRRRLALATDHTQRLAAARRRRRVEATPVSLRPAVYAFEADLLHAQQRAARAGTRPRSDHTIETALGTVRDLAIFLAGRGRTDWAVVDVHDIEAFLAAQPNTRPRRLTVLRQFFRTAQAHKIILVAPTRTLKAKRHKGFTGATLRLDQQRALYRRWTSTTPHPHEALLGLLALLHGASCQEVRLARCQDIDSATRSLRLGRRPVPTPLDPATWTGTATGPSPPRRPGHRQPAPACHQRHQGRQPASLHRLPHPPA